MLVAMQARLTDMFEGGIEIYIYIHVQMKIYFGDLSGDNLA